MEAGSSYFFSLMLADYFFSSAAGASPAGAAGVSPAGAAASPAGVAGAVAAGVGDEVAGASAAGSLQPTWTNDRATNRHANPKFFMGISKCFNSTEILRLSRIVYRI